MSVLVGTAYLAVELKTPTAKELIFASTTNIFKQMNKAKAAGISASSFFDLKAELSKHENQFAKNKAAGKSTTIVGGVKRPDKVSLKSLTF